MVVYSEEFLKVLDQSLVGGGTGKSLTKQLHPFVLVGLNESTQLFFVLDRNLLQQFISLHMLLEYDFCGSSGGHPMGS